MKKITLAITFLSIVYFNSSAQSIAIGPKIGIDFSKLRGDDADDFELQPGFTGGLFVNLTGPKGILALEPQLMFQQRGAKSEGVAVTHRIHVDYLTIPVLFKLRIPIDETFYPHIYAGPQFSFLVRSKYDAEILDEFQVSKEDLDFRKGDVGGVFGAGLDVQSDRFLFSVQLQYGLGALSIDEDFEFKNSSFTILTGFGIRIGN